MLQAGPLISVSPSFTTTNAYSSSSAGNLAEIAARVVNELRRENPDSVANFLFDDDDDQPWLHSRNDNNSDGESEFEFASAAARDSPISADEIFQNGQIKSGYVYPLFGKSLVDLAQAEEAPKLKETSRGNDGIALPLPLPPRRRQPLGKLMGEEEWTSTSSSDIDALRPGTYCAWDPNDRRKNRISASEKKKSRSTGTATNSPAGSRRWNLRDFILNRSTSDGGPKEPATKKGGKIAAATETETETEEESRPYNKKKDLVGFLSNVNGLSRNLHPF